MTRSTVTYHLKQATPTHCTASYKQLLADIVMSHWNTMGAGMTDIASGNAAVSKRHAIPVIPEFSGFHQNSKNASVIVCVTL